MSHPGTVIPQDIVPNDDEDDVLTALPVTQAEIDELVFGEDRPAAERLERLQELRAILNDQQPGDVAGNDATTLLGSLDDGIARLSGGLDREEDGGMLDAAVDDDASYHRETLAPDSDELLDIEAEDEASVTGDMADLDDDDDLAELEDDDLKGLDEADRKDGLDVLDPKEWDEGDGIGRL